MRATERFKPFATKQLAASAAFDKVAAHRRQRGLDVVLKGDGWR